MLTITPAAVTAAVPTAAIPQSEAEDLRSPAACLEETFLRRTRTDHTPMPYVMPTMVPSDATRKMQARPPTIMPLPRELSIVL